MGTTDPLERFEQLAVCAGGEMPPDVHVAAKVARRVQAAEATSDRVLVFLAAGACVAAVAVMMVGALQLSDLGNALEGLLEIVPPIGL